ncbi:MAG: hypothetical protein E6H07_12890 [Bacteroidetes bacterium]|nr:MAG: hypothetical protein E6H07_12890 [Bacteroidota bacterium]
MIKGKATRILIDKLTNSVEKRTTGKSHATSIVLVSAEEIRTVLKKNGWYFNWKKEYKEEGRHTYKLTLAGDTNIHGLLCLEPRDNYIEMHLIESAPHNYGKEKEYIGVPGNLVSFACKMSFEMGFDGNVAFTAKTKLKQHYIDTLGAVVLFGDRMGIMGESAKKLVNSYYQDFFNEG